MRIQQHRPISFGAKYEAFMHSKHAEALKEMSKSAPLHNKLPLDAHNYFRTYGVKKALASHFPKDDILNLKIKTVSANNIGDPDAINGRKVAAKLSYLPGGIYGNGKIELPLDEIDVSADINAFIKWLRNKIKS